MQYLGSLQRQFGTISSFTLELMYLLALICIIVILIEVVFRFSRKRKLDKLFYTTLIILSSLVIMIYFFYFQYHSFVTSDTNQMTYEIILEDQGTEDIELNDLQVSIVDSIIREGKYKLASEPLYRIHRLRNQIGLRIYDKYNPGQSIYFIFNDEEVNVVYSPNMKHQLIVDFDVEGLYNYLQSEFDF